MKLSMINFSINLNLAFRLYKEHTVKKINDSFIDKFWNSSFWDYHDIIYSGNVIVDEIMIKLDENFD